MALRKLLPVEKTMIEEFQCPGCVCGGQIKDCDAFTLERGSEGFNWFRCSGHVAGTRMYPGGRFVLGLPKGFCKVGELDKEAHGATTNIRLWRKGTKPVWDRCNVPVWAMEKDFLFVRTYMPRVNIATVEVIEGGRRAELCPQSIDVAEFLGEID